MFKLVIELKDVDTKVGSGFGEVFELLFREIKAQNGRGTPLQIIAEANWIAIQQPGRDEEVLGWFEARDVAYKLGLMEDGRLVDPLPKISDAQFLAALAACRVEWSRTNTEALGTESFTEQGKGKIVKLYFPDDTKTDLQEIKGSLAQGLQMPMNWIGHIWGINHIIEFLWASELDDAAVNRELNRLKQEFPGLRIEFGEESVITM